MRRLVDTPVCSLPRWEFGWALGKVQNEARNSQGRFEKMGPPGCHPGGRSAVGNFMIPSAG